MGQQLHGNTKQGLWGGEERRVTDLLRPWDIHSSAFILAECPLVGGGTPWERGRPHLGGD